MDMTESKRVAIIGAGLCGLGAIKCFLDEGLQPVCFERSGYIGGLWRYHDDDVDGLASVMKNTIINTSKEIGAFSNFPPPAEFPNYMHNSLMYKYIQMRAEKTDAYSYIRFYHETLKIEKADDYETTGRWKVTNRNTETGETVIEVFDCVATCIGHHVYPNEPVFPGQVEFQGRITHTHSLKNIKGFEDKRVVVVGVGNSGMDAAVEISAVASQVYLSTRRGTWVLSRIGPHGLPLDIAYLRRCFNLLKDYLPYDLLCYFAEKELSSRFNHDIYNLKPNHRILSQHPTVSDTLPIKLLSGTVVTRGAIKRYTKNGVIFDGEEDETEVDAVILATGYKVKFSFLSKDILKVVDNRVPLYKFIFPPDLPHPTLAIIGQIQPSGPGIPCIEIQCRWTARVFSGKLKLPPKEQMYKDIQKKEAFLRKHFVNTQRHTFQVDFIGYQDELAEEIGVKPNLLKLAITDPKLFWAIFFGPSLPYQYRLQGPHSWPGAKNAILTYKDRLMAPLQRPGVEYKKRGKYFLNNGLLIKALFLIPLVWYFFLTVLLSEF